jgi:hypothetical protein
VRVAVTCACAAVVAVTKETTVNPITN